MALSGLFSGRPGPGKTGGATSHSLREGYHPVGLFNKCQLSLSLGQALGWQCPSLGTSTYTFVSPGLQCPPVCGAHGPRLLPSEQPSFLQAVPRETECCGMLLKALARVLP
jgi:hypothetical protein